MILGTLPKDLATCMVVQFDGERESLHKHARLCVSVQQLKVEFNWLLTHNWDWIDATSAYSVDVPAGNYGSAINALLQTYAQEVPADQPAAPASLLQSATPLDTAAAAQAEPGPVDAAAEDRDGMETGCPTGAIGNVPDRGAADANGQWNNADNAADWQWS